MTSYLDDPEMIAAIEEGKHPPQSFGRARERVYLLTDFAKLQWIAKHGILPLFSEYKKWMDSEDWFNPNSNLVKWFHERNVTNEDAMVSLILLAVERMIKGGEVDMKESEVENLIKEHRNAQTFPSTWPTRFGQDDTWP